MAFSSTVSPGFFHILSYSVSHYGSLSIVLSAFWTLIIPWRRRLCLDCSFTCTPVPSTMPRMGLRGNNEMGVSDSQSSPVPGACVTGKNRPALLHSVVSEEAGCGRAEVGRTQEGPPQAWKFLESTGGSLPPGIFRREWPPSDQNGCLETRAGLSSCSHGWAPSQSGSSSRGRKAPGGPASCSLERAPSLMST
ncbi:hypothetical protein HJG60_008305 [Phyllostomus discolor]|uniref:Uncharacterized protein n=1 Tax=Phyllostomus discolor TaxID=89673 RepID=A0A834DM18_9CHIR|nr:hypothetical protein HJG60_008305 [Phyllostomus discolor]